MPDPLEALIDAVPAAAPSGPAPADANDLAALIDAVPAVGGLAAPGMAAAGMNAPSVMAPQQPQRIRPTPEQNLRLVQMMDAAAQRPENLPALGAPVRNPDGSIFDPQSGRTLTPAEITEARAINLANNPLVEQQRGTLADIGVGLGRSVRDTMAVVPQAVRQLHIAGERLGQGLGQIPGLQQLGSEIESENRAASAKLGAAAQEALGAAPQGAAGKISHFGGTIAKMVALGPMAGGVEFGVGAADDMYNRTGSATASIGAGVLAYASTFAGAKAADVAGQTVAKSLLAPINARIAGAAAGKNLATANEAVGRAVATGNWPLVQALITDLAGGAAQGIPMTMLPKFGNAIIEEVANNGDLARRLQEELSTTPQALATGMAGGAAGRIAGRFVTGEYAIRPRRKAIPTEPEPFAIPVRNRAGPDGSPPKPPGPQPLLGGPGTPPEIPPTRPEARRAARSDAESTARDIVNDARWDNARASELRQALRDEFGLGAAQAARIVASAITNRNPSTIAQEAEQQLAEGQAQQDAARQTASDDALARAASAGQVQTRDAFARIQAEAEAGTGEPPAIPSPAPKPPAIRGSRTAQSVPPAVGQMLDTEYGTQPVQGRGRPGSPAPAAVTGREAQQPPAPVRPAPAGMTGQSEKFGERLRIPDVPRATEIPTDQLQAGGWRPETDLVDGPLPWQDADFVARAAREDNPGRDYAITPADPAADTWNVVNRERRWDSPPPPPRKEPPRANLRPARSAPVAPAQPQPASVDPERLAPQGTPPAPMPSADGGADRPQPGQAAEGELRSADLTPAGKPAILSPDADRATPQPAGPSPDRPGQTGISTDARRRRVPPAQRPAPPAPQAPAREPKRGEYGRHSVARQLNDWWAQHPENQSSPDLAEADREFAGTDTFTADFAGPLPGEVVDYIDRGSPGWHWRQQHFRANVRGARGEDVLAALGDRYFQRLEAMEKSQTRQAIEAARKAADQDPKAAFLAWAYDRLPEPVDTGRRDAAGRRIREADEPFHIVDNPGEALPDGTELSIFGTRFRVMQDGWAHALVELNDAGEPTHTRTYLEAIEALPVDPGSIKQPPAAPANNNTTLPSSPPEPPASGAPSDEPVRTRDGVPETARPGRQDNDGLGAPADAAGQGNPRPGAAAEIARRATEYNWPERFTQQLTSTVAGLSDGAQRLIETDPGSFRVMYKGSLEDIPEPLRPAFASAAAVTVNHSRIEFVGDKMPSTEVMHHELVHLYWYRMQRQAPELLKEANERATAIGEQMLAEALKPITTRKAAPPEYKDDPFAWSDARDLRRDFQRLKQHPERIKDSLELNLMVGGFGPRSLARRLGIEVTDDNGQYLTVALYRAMAKRLGVEHYLGEYGDEEHVAYLAGTDPDFANRLFGAMADAGSETRQMKPIAGLRKQIEPAGRKPDVDEQTGFWSPAQRYIAEKVKGPMPADQMLKAMRGAQITADELRFTGLEDWLKEKGTARVTPAEAQDFIEKNKIALRVIDLKGSNTHKDEMAQLQREIDSRRADLMRTATGAILRRTALDGEDLQELVDGIVHGAEGPSADYNGGESGKGLQWDDFVDVMKDDHPGLEAIKDYPELRQIYNGLRDKADRMEVLKAGDPEQQEVELFEAAGSAKQQLKNAAKRAALDHRATETQARDFANFLGEASQPAHNSIAWDDIQNGTQGPRALVRNNWIRWAGSVAGEAAGVMLPPDVMDRLQKMTAESFVAWKAAKEAEHARRVRSPKFEGTQHEGGTNYRERLMVLPPRSTKASADLAEYERLSNMRTAEMTPAERQRYSDLTGTIGDGPSVAALARQSEFTRHHWPEISSNVMANALLSDWNALGADGKAAAVLHAQEIQSDWHQQGRDSGYKEPVPESVWSKWTAHATTTDSYQLVNGEGKDIGFRAPAHMHDSAEAYLRMMQKAARDGIIDAEGKSQSGPPPAPWSKNWHEAVLRHLVHEAAKTGKDALTWSTGEMQLEKWRQLSSAVKSIVWGGTGNGPNKEVNIYTDGDSFNMILDGEGKVIDAGRADHSQMLGRHIAEIIGKDQAAEIMGSRSGHRDVRSHGLRIGGDGMRDFYDRDLPNYARKLAERLGTTVEKFTIQAGKPPGKTMDPRPSAYTVTGIRLTPEVRARILREGMPAFGNPPPPPPVQGTSRGGPGARPGMVLNPFARGPKRPATPAVKNLAGKIHHGTSLGTKLRNLIRRPFSRIYTALFEEAHALARQQRDLLRAAGMRPESAAADPYQALRARRGAAVGTVDHMVRDGMVSMNGAKTGPGLVEILKPIASRLQEFETYAVARQIQHRLGLGQPQAISQQDADQVVQDLKSPEFDTALEAVSEWNRGILRYLVEAGGLSPTAYTELTTKYPIYIPLQRHFDDETNPAASAAAGGGKGMVNQASPIKKAKGSERDYVSPIDAMVAQALQTIKIANKIYATRELATFAENMPDGDTIAKKIPPSALPSSVRVETAIKALEDLGITVDTSTATNPLQGDETFLQFTMLSRGDKLHNQAVIWRNGKQEAWEFDPEVFRAIADLDREYLPWFVVKILGAPKRMIQTFATQLNPVFGIRNFVRDAMTYNIQRTNAGIVPDFTATPRELLAQALGKEHTARFSGGGGHMVALKTQDRAEAGSMARVPLSTWRKADPIQLYRRVGGAIETAPRLAEFKRVWEDAKRRWGDTPRALDAAIAAAKDATTDFTRAGVYLRAAAPLIPFLNARLQSWDRFLRNFNRHNDGIGPGKPSMLGTLAAAFTTLTIPSLVLWWLNKDEDWYKEIPADQRSRFWFFKVGDTIYKLPKPFELGQLFGTIPEEALNRLHQKDPATAQAVAAELIAPLSPITGWNDITPPALGTPIEAAANYDVRRGSPIVPRDELDRKPPAEQYSQHTTETFKAIGKALDISPRKLEFFANSWFGGMPTGAAGTLERVLGIVDVKDKPGETAANRIPLLNAFVQRDPASAGQAASVDLFYEKLRTATQQANANQPSQTAIDAFYSMKPYQDAIATLRKARDDQQMDAAEANRQITALAKAALRERAVAAWK